MSNIKRGSINIVRPPVKSELVIGECDSDMLVDNPENLSIYYRKLLPFGKEINLLEIAPTQFMEPSQPKKITGIQICRIYFDDFRVNKRGSIRVMKVGTLDAKNNRRNYAFKVKLSPYLGAITLTGYLDVETATIRLDFDPGEYRFSMVGYSIRAWREY